MSVNQSILVVGYGSLLSGYGLMAQRRGGGSKLLARDAYPVIIENGMRGLAKPSSHGQYDVLGRMIRETRKPKRRKPNTA